MNSAAELPFRILAGLLGVLAFGIRGYYQRRVKDVAKTLSDYDRQDTSPRALLTYASLPVALYIFTPWLDFAHLPLPLWLRRLGVALAWAGAALFVWTHRALGGWTRKKR